MTFDMRAVTVDILTGFLGSGKTTLLRHVLAHGLQGRRVAVIMNELGEVGIDGRVLTGLTNVERVVELSNGCICCSIDEYRFVAAVQELVATVQPDVIVIESTGIADPEPLIARVAEAGLRLDAVITVVDAAQIARQLVVDVAAVAQVEAADFVVVNKCDLVDDAALAVIEADLRQRNPRAEQVRAVRGAVGSEILFATGVAHYRERARAGSMHRDVDGYECFAIRSGAAHDLAGLQQFLTTLPADVVRAKGFMRIAGRDPVCLFNVTCGRVEWSWFNLATVGESQAVFIGRGVLAHRDSIENALAGCHAPPERAGRSGIAARHLPTTNNDTATV